MHEAGAVVVGGHTIESEAQFGYAVTGLVDPERVVANTGARAGDVAYLTKSVGMGPVTVASKSKKLSWDEVEPAALQMAQLNDRAARAMETVDAHACTDVTGFGLVGHAHNVAMASEACLRIRVSDVPLFPGALELARQGLVTGGAKRGQTALGATVRIGAGLEEPLVNLLFDAETSGGLLIVVDAADASALERALGENEVAVHCIGELVPRDGHAIELV